jgi:uncharacterized protein DUF6894
MPLYYFHLHDGIAVLRDDEGTDLSNITAARAHARKVARELMQQRDIRGRRGMLEVCDEAASLFDLHFAAVDPQLDHLDPRLREGLERLSESRARCMDSLRRYRQNVLQLKVLNASVHASRS